MSKKEAKLHKRKKFNFFDVFVTVFCIAFGLVCFYPMWYVFVVSITPYDVFINKTMVLLPPFPPDFQYYQSILTSSLFRQSIFISIFKTLVGTTLAVMITSSMAYAVSKSHVKGMKIINFIVVFTMFFSGGLIPTYVLYRDLGMLKTIFPMILPGAISVTYFIIMRNYFLYSVPPDLEDAAAIDGANQVTIFFKLVLPISVPMLAAVSLFIGVAQWNDYYSYMMYVNEPRLQPYVWVLRRMLVDPGFTNSVSANAEATLGIPNLPAFALRMSTIVTAMLPIMIVYPFLQKYFAQGMLIGAVKG